MSEDKEKSQEKKIIIKNNIDLQRLKLSKLMKNPDKPVIIPDRPKERSVPSIPDFVRNVMGSSAGAGSGEFHVYRHLRRKEYARQKYMQEKAHREKLDEEYHKKLEENRKLAELRTEKKRKKRLKKKYYKKRKNVKESNKNSSVEETESSEASDGIDSKNEEGEKGSEVDEKPEK